MQPVFQDMPAIELPAWDYEANLSGRDLRGANFSGADLTCANLEGANLSGADLVGTCLSEANLVGANLSEADLSGAILSWADLSGAVLFKAYLVGAILRWADLVGADLVGANLSGADLVGADLREANLSGADLREALLPDVPVVPDIDRAILERVVRDGLGLDMTSWHTCDATHCRAGWAIHLAGAAGYALEERIGSNAAAALIYAASRPEMPVPSFFDDDATALADLRACAAASTGDEVEVIVRNEGGACRAANTASPERPNPAFSTTGDRRSNMNQTESNQRIT